MVYFFVCEDYISFQTYLNKIIYCYCWYILLIVLFPVIRFFIKSKQFILMCLMNLGFILWHYYLEAYTLFFCDTATFLDFSSITTFSNILDFNLSFTISPISFSFSFLVLIIGFSTNLYLLNYFKGEADELGFIFWINAFIISMLFLILSNNFFSLFLGWELIGLTSFFLINFWHNKRSTLKSSFKAFSFNLFSDLLLLGAFVIFYQITHTSDISAFIYIVTWESASHSNLLNFGILLLIGCASIKSVQIIGHLWLPDSMEAPVPASALIHSATLVSAGIYLLTRFNYLLLLFNWTPILIFVGSLTAAYGGVVAAAQTDMKKLLAYSTMSHCGFLMILVACSNFYALVTYLFLHGLFKASTFYCAGSFIRIYGSQDTRVMGGNNNFFVGEFILLLICAGNLAGLPLSIGVLYKNFFLSINFFYNINLLSGGLIFLGLLTGIIYFYRLVYYSYFDLTKSNALSAYEILEVTTIKFRTFHGFTNITHLIATIILLFFSFFIFGCVLWMVNLSFVQHEVGIFNNFISTSLLQIAIHLYTTNLLYFYFIYLILIFVLIFCTWRYQIIWSFKFEFIFISVFCILIFSFFTVFF